MFLRLFAFVACVCYAVTVCPENWAEFNGECIFFGHDRRSWVQSEDMCRKMDAYLVTDDNPTKHEFLKNVASVMHSNRINRFWTGASDYAIEGSWRWLETGLPINGFSKWLDGRPIVNITLDCMAFEWLGNELHWVDIDCNDRGTSFICEKADVAP